MVWFLAPHSRRVAQVLRKVPKVPMRLNLIDSRTCDKARRQPAPASPPPGSRGVTVSCLRCPFLRASLENR